MTQFKNESPHTLPDAIGEQVNLLASMAAEFANTLNVEETLLKAVERISDFLDAEGGAVFLLDEATQIITCIVCSGATEITGIKLEYGQGIVGKCVATNEGAMVRDVQNDPNFFAAVDAATGFVTRSILCAPLSVKDRCVGAIELVNKRDNNLFEEKDLRVLETLASSAALAVINARMAKALVEQERVKRELELAAEIQKRFLPNPITLDGRVPISGINKAARGVSGDFYDYFQLPDGRIYFALGDVSGKGMNAALLMSKTASLFRCLGKTIREPGRLLGLINAELCETATHGMFVTMVAGLYDPRPGCQGLIRLSNAGHEPVLLHNEDGFSTFGADGPPLGIVPPLPGEDGAYLEVDILPKGGSLYVYTDGLTEGYTASGATFETEGVKTFLTTHPEADVEKRLTNLVANVALHNRSLRDDVTILALDDKMVSPEAAPDSHHIVADDQGADVDGDWVISFKFPARPTWMKMARACVREACEKLGIEDKKIADVVLAVDEACQNVIRHAYGGPSDQKIELDVRHRPSRLIFRLRDFAAPVEPGRIKPRDLNDIRPGGLGTHLIREVMDDVQFLRPQQGEGNILRLVKYIDHHEG